MFKDNEIISVQIVMIIQYKVASLTTKKQQNAAGKAMIVNMYSCFLLPVIFMLLLEPPSSELTCSTSDISGPLVLWTAEIHHQNRVYELRK